MTMSYDYRHPCPRCGSPWRLRIVSVAAGGRYGVRDGHFAAGGSGECSNSECVISPTEAAAFRATRRRGGWDRWVTQPI
jgi:hypothetical protein